MKIIQVFCTTFFVDSLTSFIEIKMLVKVWNIFQQWPLYSDSTVNELKSKCDNVVLDIAIASSSPWPCNSPFLFY